MRAQNPSTWLGEGRGAAPSLALPSPKTKPGRLHKRIDTPTWLDIPAMMPIVISTPNILQRLDPRPFSFLLLPQIDSGGGHPADVDNSRFTLVTSFTSKRNEWLKSECINIFDGKVYQLAVEQTPKLDKVIPRTYAHVLYLYTTLPLLLLRTSP